MAPIATDSSIGRRFNGDAPRGARQGEDFYPTPRAGTEALLNVETFDGTIWEPACGDGAISRVLMDHGHQVISTDLIDRGYGQTGVDFLTQKNLIADNIVTNPPFMLAVKFVEVGLSLGSCKIAMLMQLRFLEGISRGSLFDRSPPSRLWVFRKRLVIESGPPIKKSTLFGDIEEREGSRGGR